MSLQFITGFQPEEQLEQLGSSQAGWGSEHERMSTLKRGACLPVPLFFFGTFVSFFWGVTYIIIFPLKSRNVRSAFFLLRASEFLLEFVPSETTWRSKNIIL